MDEDRIASIKLRVDIEDEARIVSIALIEEIGTLQRYMQTLMTWREARVIAHHILEHTSDKEEK